MNRIERRAYIRNIKKLKEIQHNATKGAFGKLPLHLEAERVRKIEQKVRKMFEEDKAKVAENDQKSVETPEKVEKSPILDQKEVE